MNSFSLSLSSGSSKQQHRSVEIYLFFRNLLFVENYISRLPKKKSVRREREKIVDNEVEKKKLNARELTER